VTGELLNYRQLHIPFLVADLHGCNDISDCIGSTATGVIDPDRDSWYVTTKTYVDQNNQSPQGLANGRYYIHALDTITLGEKQGFPIPLEGVVGENAPWRVFESGKHHQRPAMMQVRITRGGEIPGLHGFLTDAHRWATMSMLVLPAIVCSTISQAGSSVGMRDLES